MTNIKLFQDKKIRSAWNEEEEQWYFSLVDVVEALTDSPNPRQYWRKMKDRDLKEYELYPFWVQLKMPSADGKKYATDCANVKGILRIIQSIPSPKAEPFKHWSAAVAIPDEDAAYLASEFEFTGAEIDNIVQKMEVYEALHGHFPPINTIVRFCKHNKFNTNFMFQNEE